MSKTDSKGAMTENGYKIEARVARFNCFNPVQLSDGLLGPEWREVQFERGNNPAGIPVEGFGEKHNHRLLTYEGAMALAWTLVAQQRNCPIECRLVAYKLETTWALEVSGIVDMPPIENLWPDIAPLVRSTATVQKP